MTAALKRIWHVFISLRLTIALLIILSAVCVIGTVVPQNEPPQTYQRAYAPTTYAALKTLGFTDLYHAWWFTGLLAAFTLNLIACSLHRLPRVLRQTARTDPVLTDERIQTLAPVKTFKLKQFSPDDAPAIAEALRRHCARPVMVSSGETLHFFSEQGRWAPFSFYLTHVGLVIIIIGALAGVFGFQGFMRLAEGETSSVVVEKKSTAPQQLDFAVRCDAFEVTYYEKTGTPRDYVSTLTVLEDGRDVLTKKIEVNDPLVYKGIYFYQSSYGIAPGGEATVRITPRGEATGREYRMPVGKRFRIDETPDEAEIEHLIPDFALDEQGSFFSRSEEPRNPAVRMVIYSPGKEPYRLWAFAQFPDFHRKPDAPCDVQFLHFHPRYYTGLQVTRDPGVWIVWAGCAALIAGIFGALFSSHRRIWLRIIRQADGATATLAGACTKNRAAFAALMDRLHTELKKTGSRAC